MNRKLHFSIYIPAHEYQAYYSGVARNVSTRTREGISIQFPASALQRFVTHEGIQGDFEIEFDQNNKLVAVHRV